MSYISSNIAANLESLSRTFGNGITFAPTTGGSGSMPYTITMLSQPDTSSEIYAGRYAVDQYLCHIALAFLGRPNGGNPAYPNYGTPSTFGVDPTFKAEFENSPVFQTALSTDKLNVYTEIINYGLRLSSSIHFVTYLNATHSKLNGYEGNIINFAAAIPINEGYNQNTNTPEITTDSEDYKTYYEMISGPNTTINDVIAYFKSRISGSDVSDFTNDFIPETCFVGITSPDPYPYQNQQGQGHDYIHLNLNQPPTPTPPFQPSPNSIFATQKILSTE